MDMDIFFLIDSYRTSIKNFCYFAFTIDKAILPINQQFDAEVQDL
jgi:hypothetical protein